MFWFSLTALVNLVSRENAFFQRQTKDINYPMNIMEHLAAKVLDIFLTSWWRPKAEQREELLLDTTPNEC